MGAYSVSPGALEVVGCSRERSAILLRKVPEELSDCSELDIRAIPLLPLLGLRGLF